MKFIFEKSNINLSSAYLPIIIIFFIVFLTFRNSGLYPMIFADEWLYGAYSRYMTAESSVRPSFLYFFIYRITNYCGSAYLDCARQINILFFVLSAPLIYAVARRFVTANMSIVIVLYSLLSPINSFTAYFMPESMYYFLFWLFNWIIFCQLESNPLKANILSSSVLACMALVKPHSIFLYPSFFIYGYIVLYYAKTNRNLFYLSKFFVFSMSTFLIVRLALGFVFAGKNGLNIMGNDYGGIASEMSGAAYLFSLLPMASFNLFGHLLIILVLFSIPIIFLIYVLLNHNEMNEDGIIAKTGLLLYSGSLLIILSIIVALFSAKAVSMGPYESIGRLSLRHYNFTFPLLIIVAGIGAELMKSKRIIKSSISMCCIIFLIFVALLYVLINKFNGFNPYFIDSPEWVALTQYESGFLTLIITGIICLFVFLINIKIATRLYLFLFFPVYLLISTITVSSNFSPRLIPDVYDLAGKFTNDYLGKDTAKLVIIGPDLASLYRTHFYMKTPETLFYAVPNGSDIDPKFLSNNKVWLLLIGNYQESFISFEKIYFDVIITNDKSNNRYRLIKLAH
jgi:phosphoglycerol transferase